MNLKKSLILSLALLAVGLFQPSAQAALIYTNFTIPGDSPNTGIFTIGNSALWDIAHLSTSGSWDYRYAYQSFRVSQTGVYTMGMTDGVFDALMILYSGSTTFPANPATGAIALVDDGEWDYNATTKQYYFDTQLVNPLAVPDGSGSYFPGWLPMIKNQTLTANTDYLVAISTFSPANMTGLANFTRLSLPSTFFVAGPAEVTLYGSAAVPEPGQVAASILLLAGIGGYVWLKRRKQKPAV